MSGQIFLVLATLCLFISPNLASRFLKDDFLDVAKNDSAPVVMVSMIGSDYVMFDVSGANTFHHLPVKSIHVNYTQVMSREMANSSNANSKSHHVVHSKLGFDRMVNISGLNAGASYQFEFYITNTAGEQSPARMIMVLLKPQTPDFSITHQSPGTIRLFWGYPDEKQIDYFLLTVDKVIFNLEFLSLFTYQTSFLLTSNRNKVVALRSTLRDASAAATIWQTLLMVRRTSSPSSRTILPATVTPLRLSSLTINP